MNKTEQVFSSYLNLEAVILAFQKREAQDSILFLREAG